MIFKDRLEGNITHLQFSTLSPILVFFNTTVNIFKIHLQQ